jgi:hypothetical protein
MGLLLFAAACIGLWLWGMGVDRRENERRLREAAREEMQGD